MKKIREYGGLILFIITFVICLSLYQQRIAELRAMEDTNIVEAI